MAVVASLSQAPDPNPPYTPGLEGILKPGAQDLPTPPLLDQDGKDSLEEECHFPQRSSWRRGNLTHDRKGHPSNLQHLTVAWEEKSKF